MLLTFFALMWHYPGMLVYVLIQLRLQYEFLSTAHLFAQVFLSWFFSWASQFMHSTFVTPKIA